MSKITLSKFETACAVIVRKVAESGESVTITHRGKELVRIVPAHPEKADQSDLQRVGATLDLDEDVIDDAELWEGADANRTWDALNSAIARDVASQPTPTPTPRSPRKRAKT